MTEPEPTLDARYLHGLTLVISWGITCVALLANVVLLWALVVRGCI